MSNKSANFSLDPASNLHRGRHPCATKNHGTKKLNSGGKSVLVDVSVSLLNQFYLPVAQKVDNRG